MKGGESKSEEVFEEKENQELEEQEEGEDKCPRVGTHQRQQKRFAVHTPSSSSTGLKPRWSVTSSSCSYAVSSRMTLSSSVPQWLNFATGVVDSEDLLLTIAWGGAAKQNLSLDQEGS